MIHAIHDNPYYIENHDYDPYDPENPYSLTYYKLNPKIVEGSTDDLCHYKERTFTTDITHMPEGTLKWTHDNNYLTRVSDTDTDATYTVVKSSAGIGETWVRLDINTLSAFEWHKTINFSATRTPEIANQKVDGGSYYYGMEICPGEHCLSVTPVGGNTTTTWTVPPGIYHEVGADDTTLDFFLFSPSSFTITVRSENTCGTDSRSFYLTEPYYGCYGMTLFPNPASDNVTISMIESDTTITTGVATADAKANEPTTYTIRIYDSQSFLLSTVTRSGKNFDIPLINMREGIYVIEVSDGENSYRQQLVVKHD